MRYTPTRRGRGPSAAVAILLVSAGGAALGAGCQAPTSMPPSADADELRHLGGFDPRPWRMVLAAAPCDAEAAQDPVQRLEAVEEAGRFGRAVLTGFRRTPPAERRWLEVMESLGYLDMKGLYALAERAPGAQGAAGWRRFGFRGGRVDEQFLFDIDHPEVRSTLREAEVAEARSLRLDAGTGDGEAGADATGGASRAAAAGPGAVASEASPESPAAAAAGAAEPAQLAAFGRVRGHLGLRPEPGRSDLFRVRFAADVTTAGLRWEAMQDAFVELLRFVDLAGRRDARALRAASPGTRPSERFAPPALDLPPPPQALQAVQALWPKLEGDSAELAADALRGFPSTLPVLARFAIPERLIAVRKSDPADEAALGRSYTEVDFRFRLDRPAFRKAYPRLDEYLEGLEDLLEVRFRLEDEAGREVFLIKLDTIDFRASLEAAVAGGKLLPRDGIRRPVWDAAIDPYMASARPRWSVDLVIHLRGIDLELTGLRVEAELEQRLGFAGLRAVLRTPPTARARGALFGFLPVDVLDLVIPSNLEELAVRFLRTLARSNGGEGAIFETLLLPGALESRVAVKGALDLEDSGFLGFAMRLFGSRIMPRPEVRAEWMRLMRQVVDAAATDFDRYRAHRDRDPAGGGGDAGDPGDAR